MSPGPLRAAAMRPRPPRMHREALDERMAVVVYLRTTTAHEVFRNEGAHALVLALADQIEAGAHHPRKAGSK